MKLSQSVTYAIQAALQLAQTQDGPVSCGQLAAAGKMPERFLLQILRDMTKRGILQSTRGGGGGFMLSRPPGEISLLELIEAVDGPLVAGLPMRVHFPGGSGQRLETALDQVAAATCTRLGAISLADLIRPAR